MIRIITGVYGHRTVRGIDPKDKNSPPFSLSPEQEEKLVRRGIAEYAGQTAPGTEKILPETQEPHGSKGAGMPREGAHDPQEAPESMIDEEIPDELEKPEYNAEMKLAELKAIAELYGIDTKPMISKAQVIGALDKYFEEDEAEEDDGEDPPVFGAIDPA